MSKQALRFNKGKIELTQCPTSAIAAIATVFMKNSAKYGGKYPDHNWRIGAPQTEYINCCLRHLLMHSSGVDIDETDELPHLWKALTNLAMATEAQIAHPEKDDRLNFPIDFSIFAKYLENPPELPKEVKEEAYINLSLELEKESLAAIEELQRLDSAKESGSTYQANELYDFQIGDEKEEL